MRAFLTSPVFVVFLMILGVSGVDAVTLLTASAGQPPAAKGPEGLATSPAGPDPASIADGKVLYEKSCASCHGESGKGDGPMGEELNPKPSDLTSTALKYGSRDRDIFKEVRDGIKGTGMKAFGHTLTAHQIWDLVNYLHTIGPARRGSRRPAPRAPGRAPGSLTH